MTVRLSSHVLLRGPHCSAPHRPAHPLYLLADRRRDAGLLSVHGRYTRRPGLLLCGHPVRAFFIHVEATCFVPELSNRFHCRPLRSCFLCAARRCIEAHLMVDSSSGAIIINYNRISVTVVVVALLSE